MKKEDARNGMIAEHAKLLTTCRSPLPFCSAKLLVRTTVLVGGMMDDELDKFGRRRSWSDRDPTPESACRD
jgi:hypothetical protein